MWPMVKVAPKRKKIQSSSQKSLQNIIFRIIFAFINLFISIGEVTRIALTSPFRIWKGVGSRISRFWKEVSRSLTIRRASKSALKEYPHSRKSKTAISSPVKAHISPSHIKYSKPFHLPSFHIPRIILPKILFSTISIKKQQKPYVKTAKRAKNQKQLTDSASSSDYVGVVLGGILRFLLLIIRSISAVFFYLLRFILHIIVRIFSFLAYVIKKPFQFLFSLLTVQLRFFLFGVLLCGVFFVGRELHQFVINLPSPKDIGKVNYSLATHLNDRNGKLLYEIYRDEKRTPVNVSKLPKYITQATIAIEDKDFYQHKGISIVSGILRAGRETIFKGSLQGGSTITQQLVKTALLTPERTITRKVKEIILALWTEQMYTKEQIVQMYLNQVPYGGAAYGIQEAAKTYFGKDAHDLTVAEAALLAGLPQAPSQYSPFVNPRLAVVRRNEVLLKMKEQRYITEAEYQASRAQPLQIIHPEVSIKAPHFVFFVKSELEKEYGTRLVEQGGLKVTTTLDLDIQQQVEKILRDELDKQRYLNVTNGAILVTKPSTGEIIAMAGSVDYFQQPNGAFNVTTAERQPGSSLKPLLYSLAMQKGYTSATSFDDSPTTFVLPGADPYHPINYDGKFHGRVSLRTALANSYNIPAVKALYSVGIDSFVSYMKSLGITTWNDPGRYVLPMALGGVEVKMIDEATAYGVLANEGNKVPLSGVFKLEDSRDQVMANLSPEKTRVMDPGISYIVSDILSDNVARQLTFGPGSQLEIPGYKVAVKTGTTDSKKDNWAFGYTPEYLVSVWIGNNDSTPMNPAIESGATGASSLWHRVMEYLLKNKAQQPSVWFPKPENIVEKSCFGKSELFITGTENAVSCSAPTPTTQPKKGIQPQEKSQGGQGELLKQQEAPKYNGENHVYNQR